MVTVSGHTPSETDNIFREAPGSAAQTEPNLAAHGRAVKVGRLSDGGGNCPVKRLRHARCPVRRAEWDSGSYLVLYRPGTGGGRSGVMGAAGAAVTAGIGPISVAARPGEHVTLLDVWLVMLAAAAVAILLLVVTARLVFRRVVYGPRRPWLPLSVRVRWRMYPGPGFARSWPLWRQQGLPAARRVARNARPSLGWAGRHLGSWRGYATFLGWAQGWVIRRRVYAHLESLVLTIAAPQEGKSQAAAGQIIDAPGPAVATSIRGDLIATTGGLRQRFGQLHVWNPEEEGDYGSTFRWNPVSGCADMVTAVRRAGYMVEAVNGRGLADEAFWSDQASLVLAAYLHAAGLAGGDMRHVHQWITREDQAPLRILAAHPDAAEAARDQAAMYLSLSHRTRTGIQSTLNQVLKFMQHPACVAAVTVPGGGAGFDFTAFVNSRDTLYLVAADSATSPVRPLFLAICAELAHTARQVGSVSRLARPPRGRLLGSARLARAADMLFPPRRVTRLDPPLSMELDEVANTAPVPAAAWATWAAGSGIRLHLFAQAYAQLEERWGKAGAAVIWQCCKTKVVYGATSEDELCGMVERLCGAVRLRTTERTYRGKRRHRHEDALLLPAAALRQLPDSRAVVVQGRARPTIVRVEQVRNRADYKQWRRDSAPLALPAPPQREVPAPMPSLLTTPKEDRWPGDELAARRGRNDADRQEAAGEVGEDTGAPAAVGEDTDGTAAPTPPPAGRRRPRPPSRPAPWHRPPGGEEGQ